MAANNPLEDHSSVNQGRKRKRNGPQKPDSSLNLHPVSTFYPIVEGRLTLVVVKQRNAVQLHLSDKDNLYIENTRFFTDEETAQEIITFIKNKDFSRFIRYLQANSDSQSTHVNIIIEHVYTAAKNLILTMVFLPIVDHSAYSRLYALSGEHITPPIRMPVPPPRALGSIPEQGEQEQLKLERLGSALNSARVLCSGASGSPVYRGLSPNVSAVKQDQSENGAALAPFPK